MKRRWMIFTTLGLLGSLGAVLLIQRSRVDPSIEGGILLRRLQCEQSGDSVSFEAVGINLTSRTLRGLTAEASVGVGDQLKLYTEEFEVVLRDEAIVVRETFTFDEEIDVCFIKYFANGQQVRVVYRP